MMQVKLTRDQARACQVYFFDYIDQLCAMKIRNAPSPDLLYEVVIMDLFDQVKFIFEKKLLNKGITLSINLTDSQGIVLYKLLFSLPLDRENVYLVQLRQMICNILYNKLPNSCIKA